MNVSEAEFGGNSDRIPKLHTYLLDSNIDSIVSSCIVFPRKIKI